MPNPPARPVTPARALGQVAAAAACLAAVNVAVASLARGSIARRHAAAIRSAPPCTDLFVGHSLIAGGVDAGAYDRAAPGRRALNIGLNSTGPVEHYLMLDRASDQAPARLFYGFLDDQLTRDPARDPLGDLVGNRAMALYADCYDAAAGASMYAGGDPRRYGEIRLCSALPILRERGTLWGAVERRRRRLAGLGMPPAADNRFGRVADMAAIAGDRGATRAAVRRAVAARSPLSAPVRAILRWARRRGAAAHLILMPARSAHRAGVYRSPEWAAYRAMVAAAVAEVGGELLDCSDWVGDELFEDDVHLGPAGAARFSARHAGRVPDAGPRP